LDGSVQSAVLRLLLVAICATACVKRPPPDPLATVVWDDTPLDWSTPVPATPVGGLAESGYIGSAGCEPCHAKLSASYARHSMARSGLRPLATLDAKWLARIFDTGAKTPIRHAKGGYSYRPLRQGARYYIEETLLGADGQPVRSWSQPITHSLSAGSYGLSFYSRQGKRLYHAPIDYFARIDRWDLDPAASGGNPRFSNSIGSFCISCHSDYPLRIAGSDDAFLDPLPAGVGCERCHGPGAKHAETTLREDIVNPARLPPPRRLDVCTQCHQSSGSELRADRHDFSYRPGEPMGAYRVNFVAEPVEPDRFRLLAHSERMVRSACFRASAGKLGCTSCHDPHKSSFDQPPAWWDGKCLACHKDAGHTCSDGKTERCAGCHMRAGPPSDVPLVTVTDHFIQKRPPPIRPGAAGKPRSLVAWHTLLGESLAGDDLLAIEAVALGKAGFTDEAMRLVPRALATRPRAPQIYEWLGSRYDKLGQKDNVRRARAQVVRIDRNSHQLLSYALAMLDAGTADAAEQAMQAIDRLLTIDPDDPSALEVKGMLLFRRGQTAAAEPLLRRAAQLGPMAARSHVALAALALRAGRQAEATSELEAARRIEPRDRWILEKLHAPADAGEPRITAATNWLPPEWR
jgi:Flp pilus assembly protein TadD